MMTDIELRKHIELILYVFFCLDDETEKEKPNFSSTSLLHSSIMLPELEQSL